ncbi:DUF3299 domain-containing protein [Tropicibacter sp. Alg240-R139]|uniref:DUF3299 domain-containing protein n=1 Tax=Tropicibacter sp. Alg240-R139 TaxID=2305991 RepID=UPI001F0752FB|nr:DUF3299 domain-containing protein [Tropicibacter sp. Alg240-R139]
MTRSLAGLGALSLVGDVARAADAPIAITWRDLVPQDGGTEIEALRELGVVQHGQLSTPFDQEKSGAVTTDYNGKVVRIPGYLVPLDFDGTAVTAGLLVPYVGACVHVPPPPPNQLIYVTADNAPYEAQGLFEPVTVTGLFGTSAATTQLAEVGYALSADLIEPYS